MTLSAILYIISALCLLNAARLKRNEIRREREIQRVTERAIIEGARRRIQAKRNAL